MTIKKYKLFIIRYSSGKYIKLGMIIYHTLLPYDIVQVSIYNF